MSITAATDEKLHLSRAQFYREVPEFIKAQTPLILMNIEIENIELILRMVGPRARDQVTRDIGVKVAELFGEKMHLYHVSQYRYALILMQVNYNLIQKTAGLLIANLETAMVVNGVTFSIDVKIGISHHPNHASDVDELVRTAACAGYLARLRNVDYAVYDEDFDRRERHLFRLLYDFEAALYDPQQLWMAFQPIIDLGSGEVGHAEALCRWDHPIWGVVPPDDFIPSVEKSALVLDFTQHTLDLALHFQKRLEKKAGNFKISVNLSAAIFRNQRSLARLLETMQYHNVDEKSVVFEITESSVVEHPKEASYMLQQLKEVGCLIAIDDFGTGQTSLSYIANFPIDILKIDKVFIQAVSNIKNEAIIGAAVAMADKLGIATVAEGIETAAQLEICTALGITHGQGFFFSKPLPEDNYCQWHADTRGKQLERPRRGVVEGP